MEYYRKCLLPDTKPDLSFDKDGICSVCQSFENRKEIDWKKGKKSY